MSRGFLGFGLALAALGCAGCLEEPRFENAYATELDLCTPESAPTFAARVEDCRARYLADGSCGGVLSFRGTLDHVDGVASARDLDATAYDVTTTSNGTELVHAELSGAAPYFRFVLDLDDVGGLVDSGDVSRSMDLGRTAFGVPPNLDDTRLTLTFTLQDGTASKSKQFRTGTVTITRQTSTELVGTITATNLVGDALDGCFHAFVTDTRVE